jgi:hypothetical protein
MWLQVLGAFFVETLSQKIEALDEDSFRAMKCALGNLWASVKT